MKNYYHIELNGCDDSTEFVMKLEESEAELLRRVAALSKQTSTYGCMPVMQIYSEEEHIKRYRSALGNRAYISPLIPQSEVTLELTLTEEQTEAWKEILDTPEAKAVELARKTISEIFPEYGKAYAQYTPKKPVPTVYPDKQEKTYWHCPVCKTLVVASSVMYDHTIYIYTKEYCSCGQHILWEENVDETI